MSKIQLGYFAAAFVAAIFLAACGSASGPAIPTMPNGVGARTKPAAQYQVLYRFKSISDGVNPYGGVIVGSGGVVYGTTFAGGTGGSSGCCGTVFALTPSGKTTLYSFRNGADGAFPQGGLTAGSGGVMYGITDYGGGSATCNGGCGTVYALTPSGSGYSEQVLYAFQGGSDGEVPIGNVIVDQAGAIYGTTVQGGGGPCGGSSGFGGCGTVFKLTPSGSGYTESVLYAFQGGSDGVGPRGVLMLDSSGALYGTTYQGGGATAACPGAYGRDGCGTVFKLTPSGSGYTESILYAFQGGSYDGSLPRAGVIADKNGVLYGVTGHGGPRDAGTVYALTPAGSGYSERVIFAFTNAYKQGIRPTDENGLYADASGNLYGTTVSGGIRPCHCGTVFKLSRKGSSWVEKILHSFGGSRAEDGKFARNGLVADQSGALYGVTANGGLRKSSPGTVFKITP